MKLVDKKAKKSQHYLKKAVMWLAEHGGEGADLESLLGPPSPTLPTDWIPYSVILEGMFLIQMSPLSSMNCMEEYVKVLLS